MKRFNSALVSLSVPMLACTLAVGCGDAGGGATSAKADSSAASSAKPGPSSKTAAASATPSGSPTAAAKPGGDTAAAPAVGDVGATIKYMPKACETARVFVNTGKLLGGDLGKNLDAMKGKIIGELGAKAEGDKAKKVDEVLTAGGFTVNAVRELSLCMGTGKKGIAAASFDTSGIKGTLPDLLAKAIEAGTGKAPEKKDEDGVTYLTGEKKDDVMGIKGNIVIMGDSIEDIKAVSKGAGDGAADFADATQFVVWVKAQKDEKNIQGSLKEAGADYELKVVMPPEKSKAAEWKTDSKKVIDEMNAEVAKAAPEMEKMPAFKSLEPAVKNLKLAADGDNVVATTTFPQSALAEALGEILKDPKMMGGMMGGMH